MPADARGELRDDDCDPRAGRDGVPAGRVTGLRVADPSGPASRDALTGEAGAPGRRPLLTLGALALRVEVDGVPVADLPAGARLAVGEAVVVLEGYESAGSRSEDGAGLAEGPAGPSVAARVVVEGAVEVGAAVLIEAVAVPAADALDLHAFAPRDVPGAVTAFLEEARAGGLLEVRLVHGRGRGVQRAVVRRLLAESPGVSRFADAPPARGGWGATVAWLRPPDEPDVGPGLEAAGGPAAAP